MPGSPADLPTTQPATSPLNLERFRSPTQSDRPGFRWWWQTPVPAEELVRELHAMAEAGFGEVEIGFSSGFWADEAQRDALGSVLDAAEELEVGVALTIGAEWPVRTPNTGVGTHYVSRELQYGVHYVPAGTRGPLPVPAPFDDPESLRQARLFAVTTARVVSHGTMPSIAPGPTWDWDKKTIIVPPERSTVLDANSLTDLGMNPDPDIAPSHIEWESRDEDWAIFAFWLRDTAQGVAGIFERASAEAVTGYIDEFQIGEDNREMLGRVGTELFEDSLELNADGIFWTPSMRNQFELRHGYDPTPFLPLLFAQGMCHYWVPNEEPTADFEADSGIGPRIRQDYYRLLTDLYIDEHLRTFQEWAASRGLQHKAQVAYGQNLEPIRSNREFVRLGGRAEGESLNSGDRAPVNREHPNWRFALDWQRCVVAGAHQGGTTRVSTELGAQFGSAFAFSLGDYREILNKEWAAGITKPFVHGYGSQAEDRAWPTQTRFMDFIADTWNDTHYPEWKNWKSLTDFWARGTVVLETGVPRTDIAIYRDGFLTTAARGFGDADFTAPDRLADTEALERSGYSVQYIDPIALEEENVFGGVRTVFSEGPAYRAIIVDERALTPGAAEALEEAAKFGIGVIFVGELPSQDSGFGGSHSGSDRVRSAVARALEQPSARSIPNINGAVTTLRDLDIQPRVAFTDAHLLTQWREVEGHRYVLIYNTDTHPQTVELSIEGTGSVSELLLCSGGTREIPSRNGTDRTIVTVDMPPLDVRVFNLTLAANATSPTSDHRTKRQHNTLTLADWQLRVVSEEAAGPRTIMLGGQGPCDWRAIPALAQISGTGTYTASVELPANAAREACLKFGELGGSAVVRVGTEQYGPVYTSHATLELGESLAAGGRFDIEIEVSTPLRNAALAGGRVGGPDMTDRAQGLIGEVQLHFTA